MDELNTRRTNARPQGGGGGCQGGGGGGVRYDIQEGLTPPPLLALFSHVCSLQAKPIYRCEAIYTTVTNPPYPTIRALNQEVMRFLKKPDECENL